MRRVLACMVSLFLFGVIAKAAPPVITKQVTPGTMSYQGRLQTNAGVNYTNGIYTVDFKLYDAGTAGTLLWGATYTPYVNNGFFTVILGQTGVGETANTNAVYKSVDEFWKGVWIDPNGSAKHRFLGITVHEDENNATVPTPAESFPRQELQAAPFAIQAQFAQQAVHADTADGAKGDFQVSAANKLLIGSTSSLGGLDGKLPAGEPESGDLFVANDVYVDDSLTVGKRIKGYYEMEAPGIRAPSGESLQIRGTGSTGYIDMRGETVFYGNAWVKPGYKLRMDNHYIEHIVEAPRTGMKMVAGYVNANGTEKRDPGSKYTVTRTSEGKYRVTFAEEFNNTPVVVLTVANDANSFDNFISTDGIYTDHFDVEGRDDNDDEQATYQDTPFTFIAIGD